MSIYMLQDDPVRTNKPHGLALGAHSNMKLSDRRLNPDLEAKPTSQTDDPDAEVEAEC